MIGVGAPGRSGVWICGTDTGVGKTLVAAGLVRALAGLGCRVLGLKPVVSGAVALAGMAEPVWEDLECLALAGGLAVSAELRSVYRLRAPAAPSFAARKERVAIDPGVLVATTLAQAAASEFAVVEGVGGVRVPLRGSYDTSHFAVDLGLPAVLVVGLRLGCISHALLSAEVLAARGVPLVGWVANGGIDPGYRDQDETIEALETALGLRCAARLGRLGEAGSLEQVGALEPWRKGMDHQLAEAGRALEALAGELFHVKHG